MRLRIQVFHSPPPRDTWLLGLFNGASPSLLRRRLRRARVFDLSLSPSTSVASFSTCLDLISGGGGGDFRGTNPPFDGVQPGAATLVIMGLDGGIGFVPAESAQFKESPLSYRSAHRSPVMRELIAGVAVSRFGKGSSEVSDVFAWLSGAREQTRDCNCFPNCLFERRLTQLVWGLSSLQDRCLTYPREYLSPPSCYICVCDVSVSVIS